jgi:hypothetical protein
MMSFVIRVTVDWATDLPMVKNIVMSTSALRRAATLTLPYKFAEGFCAIGWL